ncbi:TonB-dependent receptor [Fulvivirga sediminis]|uniref:TonB-dependent receptor n=1 Tax=Fulvivirga sediminis TaxID=2803949 RepID=A0A937FBI9_9BACT|nr:TonB-dependent receptor [Fulvivirga sediminis]MBL3658612.1 TonB-dependent receptor [Fulvivirga sediminis]
MRGTTIKSLFITIHLSLYVVLLASGQEITLTGFIYNHEGEALEGATVAAYPAKTIAITTANGKFSIPINSKKTNTLTVSYVGYITKEISLSSQDFKTPMNMLLQPSLQELQEVTISSNIDKLERREEALNIETVNDDFIRKNMGGSLMESLERLPGVSSIGIGSGQSKPLIRGLGFNRVSVIDKGIKHEAQQWGADHGLEIDQFRASKIKILKGPASFIYGSDAIGGVIDILPPPAPKENSLAGAVDIIGKSNNNLLGGSFNLYGRGQALFFNTRITHQNYGDYKVATDRVSVYNAPVMLNNHKVRNTAGRETNLHLDIGLIKDHIKSTFYITNTYSKSGFFANAHGLEPRQVDHELHDRSSRDILHPFQKVNHFKVINSSEFIWSANHKLITEIGYQNNLREERSNYVSHGYMPATYPDNLNIEEDLERKFNKDILSANFRDILWLGKHNLTIGINSAHQDNKISGWGFLIPSFQQLNTGTYIYDKYEINKQWLLHAAIRWDYAKIQIREYYDWFESKNAESNSAPIYIQRSSHQSRDFNNLTWSAGVNYNHDQLQLKFNIGKSFRMPIAKELGANGVNYHYYSYERGDINLNPEQSYQADLGMTWTAPSWTLEATPFFNYFQNYIYLNPTADHDYLYGAGNQVFEYTQSKVMRYGGEVSAHWKLYKTISTEVAGEFVYAQQLNGEKQGFSLPISPAPSALFSISWSPEIKRLSKTSFSVDYRVTARQNRIVPPEKETPGSQVINLRASTSIHFGQQPLLVSLQARNLLNSKYFNHTSFYRLIDMPEAGRNIILSLNIPFTIK